MAAEVEVAAPAQGRGPGEVGQQGFSLEAEGDRGEVDLRLLTAPIQAQGPGQAAAIEVRGPVVQMQVATAASTWTLDLVQAQPGDPQVLTLRCPSEVQGCEPGIGRPDWGAR